jgi:hypothetical protein
MPATTIRVRGYREFARAASKAEKSTKKVVHEKLREAATVVRVEGYRRFRRYSERSASGFRIRSRIGGVFVEQSLRKTTGQHPEYGTLQMRVALEPALDAKAGEVERNLEKAIDELADMLDGRHTIGGR